MDDDIVWKLRRMDDRRVLPAFFDRTTVCTAAAEIERLRDELKNTHKNYAHLLMQFVSEANAARRSTAPTPANTGGGADHQIPEAL